MVAPKRLDEHNTHGVALGKEVEVSGKSENKHISLLSTRVFQFFWGYGNRRFLGTTFAPDRRETLRTAKKLRFLLSPGHVMEILTPVELAPPWPPLEAWGQQKTQLFGSSKGLPAIGGKSCA